VKYVGRDMRSTQVVTTTTNLSRPGLEEAKPPTPGQGTTGACAYLVPPGTAARHASPLPASRIPAKDVGWMGVGLVIGARHAWHMQLHAHGTRTRHWCRCEAGVPNPVSTEPVVLVLVTRNAFARYQPSRCRWAQRLASIEGEPPSFAMFGGYGCMRQVPPDTRECVFRSAG
jgi:hypothetical protein